MNFSIEVGPHTDLDTLPPVKDVYVTMLAWWRLQRDG